jgi:hypothetical protein
VAGHTTGTQQKVSGMAGKLKAEPKSALSALSPQRRRLVDRSLV